MRFEYRTEPAGTALIITAALFLAALVVRPALVQVILLAMAAGPGAWALVQWLRRGHGVQICDDYLLVQNPVLRRARHIPYAAIRGYVVSGGGLAVAFEKAIPPAPDQVKRLALTDLRPESLILRPHYSLVVTSPLTHVDSLLSALSERLKNITPLKQVFSTSDLMAWIRRRRIRNFILIVLTVLCTPLYVILLGRIVASLLSYGVNNFAR
jgi:hypothetical protein